MASGVSYTDPLILTLFDIVQLVLVLVLKVLVLKSLMQTQAATLVIHLQNLTMTSVPFSPTSEAFDITQ